MLKQLPLTSLQLSELNPRKTITALEGLAASIHERGILQPLLVRPIQPTDDGAEYEVVCGSRRFSAAGLLGLLDVPCIVDEALRGDDETTRMVMLVENLQREDVPPLEEAACLMELYSSGLTFEEIGDKIGKSSKYVRRRVQLTHLGPEGAQYMTEDRLTLGAAVLLATISPADQAELLDNVADYVWDPTDGPLHERAIADSMERSYARQLAQAPFDIQATNLVKKAGACGVCPKRTGAQPDLFEMLDDKERCTDSVCWGAKTEAGFEFERELAEGHRQTVLEGKVATQQFQYGSRLLHNGPYVGYSEVCYDDTQTPQRTYGELLGEDHCEAILIRAPNGGGVWAFPKAALRTALEDAGHGFAAKAAAVQSSTVASGDRKATLEERAKARVRLRVTDMVVGANTELVEAAEWALTQWHDLLSHMLKTMPPPAYQQENPVYRRRGLRLESLEDHIRGLSLEECHGMAWEIMHARDYQPTMTDHAPALKSSIKELGLNLRKLGADAKAALEAEKTAEREAKRAARQAERRADQLGEEPTDG